jgi:tripartite ATP-independent transporter DctP family solute receptor
MKINRRSAINLGCSSLALGSLGAMSGCQASNTRTLRTADIFPEGFPTVVGLQAMADDLIARSDGRLRMKLYPGGQMGAEKDAVELTVFGGLDIVRVALAPFNTFVPETRVPALPFMFRSIPHMRAAMDGAPGQHILDSMRSHGLVGLAFYDSGARSFYTTGRPILEPSDLNGMKIRVQNSDLYVSMIRALGGNPTPIPLGEVYQALLQGVIDGAENNWPSYESLRHFEAAKFYSLTRHVISPEVVALSLKTWEKLSAEDQEHVMAAAKASVPIMRTSWDARVKRSEELVLGSEHNVEVAQPDSSLFQAQVQSVWGQFLDNPTLMKLSEDIQAVQEEPA